MAAQKSAENQNSAGFSAEERAAMKEHAAELKTAARRGAKATRADGENDVLGKIAEMPESDRAIAERIHAIIKENAPDLAPKLYYGMPAYAKDGKVLCFFQAAAKFKTRYATFGFNDIANIDDGTLWPTAFGITKLTAADEATIADLVKKAVS
ncbi:iron chaperone [Nocardia sp. NPDC127526]|uniref:iron chaperone n=1 Tax=Nocardia sp. NPDC127526 TaxID=3345393 RepID=UPI00362C4D2A